MFDDLHDNKSNSTEVSHSSMIILIYNKLCHVLFTKACILGSWFPKNIPQFLSLHVNQWLCLLIEHDYAHAACSIDLLGVFFW